MIVGERYEIIGRVGSGGMADVYKARDHKLNRMVAFKVLKAEFSNDTNFVGKFQREAQAAARLSHPNIVNVYDVGEDNGINYIVMELVEGITLKDYITRKGKLSVREATSIAIQVSLGLEAAHNSGIIHRDVKPQNIIISIDGKVKLSDFGIARATSSNTISTNMMGSVHYSSPEQVRGGYSDAKSDIYSLGITMYEMITGHVPFDGDSTVTVALKHLQEEITSPAEEVPDIPYSLECIIMKCTQKNPGLRYHDCASLLTDLKHSLVDPEGSFVVLGAAAGDTDRTMVMSEEELERVQRRSYRNDDDDDYDDDDDDDYDDDRRAYDRRRAQQDRRRGKKNNVNPDTKRIMRILMIVAGVVIALLVLFLVANAAGFFSGPGLSESNEETVKVPDVRGMTFDEAKAELKKYDLGIKEAAEEEPSNEYAKGEIKSQDPGVGERVAKNSTVTVVISSGEAAEKTTVPNVVDRSEADAEKILQDANLKVTKGEPQYSDTIAEGNVISSDPTAGTEVDEGTSVTIVVSLGKEEVTVPNLYNKSASEAEAELSAAGLVGSASEDYSDSVEAGYVISQSPESGSKLEKGGTVSYVVSLGPRTQTVEVPDVLREYPETAETRLREYGFVPVYAGTAESSLPAGTVCSTSPEPGVKLEAGSQVYYWVSSGPAQSQDPDSGSGTEGE